VSIDDIVVVFADIMKLRYRTLKSFCVYSAFLNNNVESASPMGITYQVNYSLEMLCKRELWLVFHKALLRRATSSYLEKARHMSKSV